MEARFLATSITRFASHALNRDEVIASALAKKARHLDALSSRALMGIDLGRGEDISVSFMTGQGDIPIVVGSGGGAGGKGGRRRSSLGAARWITWSWTT